MEEIWKDIKGYEGLYQVSNFGEIRSCSRARGNGGYYKSKTIVGFINSNGYRLVLFNVNGKRKRFQVHRLVAEAFIPNPNNYNCVNHKDENKLNNSVGNLEWCSHKYNANYGTRNKKISINSGKAVLMRNITTGEVIRMFYNISEAERCTGIAHQSIAKCCLSRKHYNSAGGFKWEYADNNKEIV